MAEIPEYTVAEVFLKNGQDGQPLWIIIRDQVYDVTKYADEHPGGRELIEEVAGKDATKAFEDVGHSSDAVSIMKKMKIGQLVEADRKAGKKKPAKKVEDATEGNQKKSFTAVITCGLCG